MKFYYLIITNPTFPLSIIMSKPSQHIQFLIVHYYMLWREKGHNMSLDFAVLEFSIKIEIFLAMKVFSHLLYCSGH